MGVSKLSAKVFFLKWTTPLTSLLFHEMWYIPTCSNICFIFQLLNSTPLNTFVFDAADDECALAGDVIWFFVTSSKADIEIPLVQWSGLLSQVICTEGMENSNQTQSRERHKLNWANANECETREALRAAVLRERCNETRTAHFKKIQWTILPNLLPHWERDSGYLDDHSEVFVE